MTGHYLGEFAISYIPTRHGKGSLGKDAYVQLFGDTLTRTGAASSLCTKYIATTEDPIHVHTYLSVQVRSW